MSRSTASTHPAPLPRFHKSAHALRFVALLNDLYAKRRDNKFSMLISEQHLHSYIVSQSSFQKTENKIKKHMKEAVQFGLLKQTVTTIEQKVIIMYELLAPDFVNEMVNSTDFGNTPTRGWRALNAARAQHSMSDGDNKDSFVIEMAALMVKHNVVTMKLHVTLCTQEGGATQAHVRGLVRKSKLRVVNETNETTYNEKISIK
jgi:hypothetical protein